MFVISDHGGTGRRVRLRGVWATMGVQVPLIAPKKYADFDTKSAYFLCKIRGKKAILTPFYDN